MFNVVQDEQIIQEEKTMMKRYGTRPLLLLSLFWVFGTSQAHPQAHAQGGCEHEDNPCLDTISVLEKNLNPDSIKIDTCRISPTYFQLYARKWFRVDFNEPVVDFDHFPLNTSVEYHPDLILDEYATVEEGFKTIEENYGRFLIRIGRLPDSLEDGAYLYKDGKYLTLQFECYAHVESLLADLRGLLGESLERSHWIARGGWLLGGGEDAEAEVESEVVVRITENIVWLTDRTLCATTELLRLYNIYGELVSSANTFCRGDVIEGNITTENLPSGIYFLHYQKQSFSFTIIR